MAAFDIPKLLTEVDKFCDGDQMEKLRLLAMAVVPYGMIEDTSTVLDIYRKIETRYHEGATPIFTRMMEKASFRRKYISQLSQQQACETEEIPLLYFTEILVEISDELGNAEYLRRLKNRIPEDNLGTSRDRITTAVQLFQKLIFARTISLDEDIKSLEHLSEWLDDIGRQDIAKKVKDEIKKKMDASKCADQKQDDAGNKETTTSSTTAALAKPVEESRDMSTHTNSPSV